MALTATDWGWRHAGRQAWAVRHLDLRVDDGERVLLLGPSGSGKSTLLHALAGVLGPSEGEQDGTLLVDGAHPTRVIGHCGLVLQDPESSVVLGQVGDDVAFGLENLQVPREQIWPRVRTALDQVGLDVDLNRSTSALSGGQQQRLALAGALAMGAHTLLLDEPTANLDPEGIGEITAAVDQVLRADPGRTLLVVEHRVDTWLPVIDRVVVLDDPHRQGFDPLRPVLADGPAAQVIARHRQALLRAGVWLPSEPLPRPRTTSTSSSSTPTAAPEPEWALRTLDLTIGRDRPLHEHLDLQIPSGTSTVLTGPNGAGKSTLALTLAGLLAPLAGRVEASGPLRPARTRPGRRGRRDTANPADWRSRDLITRIGSVFQHPEHQFVASTVRDELAVGLHALASDPQVPETERLDERAIDERVEQLLQQLRLDRLARANPFTLSGGEKRRLSVATVLATSPSVIILDEPTFGQDRNTWAELVAMLQGLLDQGRTVLSVTHDPAFIEVLGQHRLHLDGQRVQVVTR